MADDLTGPYILRPLIQDLPLATDDANTTVVITCVEYWDGNLYVGTSAGELLHYVSIPPDPASPDNQDTLILASRTQPTTVASQNLSKGVQQLLILPRSKKACILCNGTLTFHTLPELSPAPNTQTVSNVLWIGGIDLDLENGDTGSDEAADYILMSLRTKIRLLRIEDRITSPKSLDFPGCLIGIRRGRYACVADARSYALVDLENSQKIPLFPISSLDDTAISFEDRQANTFSPTSSQRPTNIASSPSPAHSRNTSLGTFMGGLGRVGDQRRLSAVGRPGFETPETRSGASSPARPSSYLGTPTQRPISPHRASLVPPQIENSAERQPAKRPSQHEYLTPQCVSPFAEEFLLLTGTKSDQPGVGMFVNLDGDVVRGTLEFSSFPFKLVVDGGTANLSASTSQIPSEEDNEGYVFAAMDRTIGETIQPGFEIHRWDDQAAPKYWLKLNSNPRTPTGLASYGITSAQTIKHFRYTEIANLLRSTQLDDELQNSPNQQPEDDEFTTRLGQAHARVLIWHDDKVSWAARNPILLRYDNIIEGILRKSETARLNQSKVIRLFNNIIRQEARSETAFLSLEFIRQKLSLILFADLAINKNDVDPQFNEQLLLAGGVDPRVILTMIPFLRKDIFKSSSGIMVPAGIATLIKNRFNNIQISLESDPVLARPEDFDILGLIRRYLTAWRQRKGFGSIADEQQVFASVDAALIHVLLYHDQQTSLLPGRSSTLAAELYAIVDGPLDCFGRAVQLLEEYRRLYALSRLYHSRRMARERLQTWRRILDGEPSDDAAGFTDGENEIKTYLTRQKDQELVQEFGTWLARRNPKLGVQIFTDDSAKIKFTPAQASDLLRREAPDAVKVYLEHLVFGKKNVQYANELISYYLDSVLAVLHSDQTALALLENSYITYRALSAPKPTYRQFITDNAIPDSWWHDRLRLLELLGGSYGSDFTYDVSRVLERIQPFENALVPESIILEGRQGQHLQALKLLTHGLGDYHTAINYCLLGGSSVFHPAQGPSSVGIELSQVTTRADPAELFQHLLTEFLAITAEDVRIEQTSELLSRFGGWFELLHVLERIPLEWPVEVVANFLCSALRKSVSAKNESIVIKALAGAQNLIVSVDWAEKTESMGPHIIPATDTPASVT